MGQALTSESSDCATSRPGPSRANSVRSFDLTDNIADSMKDTTEENAQKFSLSLAPPSDVVVGSPEESSAASTFGRLGATFSHIDTSAESIETSASSEAPETKGPELCLPAWFLTQNVKTVEEADALNPRISIESTETKSKKDKKNKKTSAPRGSYSISDAVYTLCHDILSSRAPHDWLGPDPFGHRFLLRTPAQGGLDFLEGVVTRFARDTGADLVCLDVQTLADLAQCFDRQQKVKRDPLLSSAMEQLYSYFGPPCHAHDYASKRRLADAAVISVLGAAGAKRSQPVANDSASEDPPTNTSPQPVSSSTPASVNKSRLTIVCLKDARALMDLEKGTKVLKFLRESLPSKTSSGSLLFVATAVQRFPEADAAWRIQDVYSGGHQENFENAEQQVNRLQKEEEAVFSKMVKKLGLPQASVIDLVPCQTGATKKLLEKDEKMGTELTNVRALKRATRFLLGPEVTVPLLEPHASWDLSKHRSVLHSFRAEIWKEEKLMRTARQILSRVRVAQVSALQLDLIATVALQVHASTNLVTSWIGESSDPWAGNRRLQKRLKKCNFYEKALTSCILDPDSLNVSFDNLRLEPETQQVITNAILMPISHPEVNSYGILAQSGARGSLFYGPPGTGKTHLAQAIASEAGANMISVSGDKILSKWVGESEKIVHALFTLSEKLHPCILFIDEADAMFGGRSEKDARHERHTLNQFLREWGGASATDRGPHVIAASNRPGDLDEAVLRRLSNKVYIGLPDEQARQDIFSIWLDDETLDEDVQLLELARVTDGFSGADIKSMCESTAQICEGEVSTEDRATRRRRLSRRHFEMARARTHPSVSPDSLHQIEQFAKRWNPASVGSPSRKRGIGFLRRKFGQT